VAYTKAANTPYGWAKGAKNVAIQDALAVRALAPVPLDRWDLRWLCLRPTLGPAAKRNGLGSDGSPSMAAQTRRSVRSATTRRLACRWGRRWSQAGDGDAQQQVCDVGIRGQKRARRDRMGRLRTGTMGPSKNTKAKIKRRTALMRYWHRADDAYKRARVARELGSHGGASDVRIIDPATREQVGTTPQRKERHEVEREQSKRIGRVPSSRG
jgi:hypothetical protein